MTVLQACDTRVELACQIAHLIGPERLANRVPLAEEEPIITINWEAKTSIGATGFSGLGKSLIRQKIEENNLLC